MSISQARRHIDSTYIVEITEYLCEGDSFQWKRLPAFLAGQSAARRSRTHRQWIGAQAGRRTAAQLA